MDKLKPPLMDPLKLLLIIASIVAAESSVSNEWVSLSKNTQFRPSQEGVRQLKQASAFASSSSSKSPFQRDYADSLGTAYDEASQAWRILGTYIDCSGDGDGDEDGDRKRKRRQRALGEDDGSGDGQNDDPYYRCSRYLLWAAYADVNYEGGGLGEYQFYNPQTKRWDNSACRLTDSQRCVRMDCHLESSKNFRLLGYYKQYNVNEFLEQLVQHHGSCTWTSSLRALMGRTYGTWPYGCSYSGRRTSNGEDLYLDIRPEWGGEMSIGLYTDDSCLTSYRDSKISVQDALGSYAARNGNDENEQNEYYYDSDAATFGSSDYFREWNEALAQYRICQPCKASSVYFEIWSSSLYSSSNNNRRGRRRVEGGGGEEGGEGEGDRDGEGEGEDHEGEEDDHKDEEEGGEEEGGGSGDDEDEQFPCQDSAGERNVNQCMLFATETQVAPAYFRDVQLATRQGSIAPSHASGLAYYSEHHSFAQWRRKWGFFTFSFLVFLSSMVTFCCLVKIKTRIRPTNQGGQQQQPSNTASAAAGQPLMWVGGPERGEASAYNNNADGASMQNSLVVVDSPMMGSNNYGGPPSSVGRYNNHSPSASPYTSYGGGRGEYDPSGNTTPSSYRHNYNRYNSQYPEDPVTF